MRNLWIFINKYSAFFLFILFFAFSVVLVVRNNSFQRTSAINSSNRIVGEVYQRIDNFRDYLHLTEANEVLAKENAALRAQLQGSHFSNTAVTGQDSLPEVRYTFLEANVINNSVHQKNNYLTINRGSRHGIKKGMGVITSKGVVGIVLNVSEHFATVQSFLHADTKVSASLANSKAFGSLVWGEGNPDPKKALLKDIPNHIKVLKGEKVVTSGYSLFPAGLPLGHVLETGLQSGDSFLNISVALDIDFNTLQYVYVILDKMAAEKEALEDKTKENG